MSATTLLVISLMGASAVSSEAIRWFPGDYFDSRVKEEFQATAMESWPGPRQLLDLWNDGGLDETDRVSLLIGAAAFHDPVLLPAYREAVVSSSPRVRQAAVYGYRDLLGDSMPDVRGGINDEDAALLGDEMRWMMQTLDLRSLFEVWLQALLAADGAGLPGWEGVTLQRGLDVSLRALDRIARVEDLDDLLEAYDLSQDLTARIGLLKLVESVTLSRFIVMPKGSRQGWGPKVYETAMVRLEDARRRWFAASCVVDGEAVLQMNLKTMGVTGVDIRSEEGCQVWVNVLERGFPNWWKSAARGLYECGGPWVEMSALSPDSQRDRDNRMRLLEWFKPLRPNARNPSAQR